MSQLETFTYLRAGPCTNYSEVFCVYSHGGSPYKINNLDKVTLLDFLPLGILNDIYTLIIGLEYNNKHKAVVSQMKIPVNPVLITIVFKYWKHYHNFGNLLVHAMTKYKWSYIHYENTCYGFGPNTHLLKNKHE